MEKFDDKPYFPGKAPIDAYGDGGFRFADMSHMGSLLLIPSGIHAWSVTAFENLTIESFNLVFAEAETIEILLLGCGYNLKLPRKSIQQAFRTHHIGLEAMDTGQAARTYNVLLGEKRAVAAALIAVDDPV